MSNVLLINGSPHVRGCTATALGVVADVLEQNFLYGEMPIAASASTYKQNVRATKE